MANKRMLSLTICDSDQFLDMPLSAQCLYFHLNIRADNDGFVGNPRKIMRLIGSNDDDLKLLIAKSFILTFESGVIVIKHWRIHNTLTKGRYHETTYTEEKSMLLLKENNAYSFIEGEPIDDSKKVEMFRLSDKRRTDGEQAENYEKKRNEKKGKEKKGIVKGKPRYYEDEQLNLAFMDYVEMRKVIKKPMTDRAITLAMSKLGDLAKGNKELALKIIDQSVLHNWQSFYPLQEEVASKPTQKKPLTEEQIEKIKRKIEGD